ncbi:hypothetical protein BBJ28_00021826 [Nothophytophthora sp. Chile5]|nr:hypothetical protein BBJ28_00021826 [Nothophytophthora sp. Chile5]
MCAAKRARRRTSSGRRRSRATGRFLPAAVTGFRDSLLLGKELFHEFLAFVDAESAATLCEAMAGSRSTLTLLFDRKHWRRLLQLHCNVALTLDQEAVKVHRSIPVASGCDELANYLSLRSQLASFSRNVAVVRGDLGSISSVEGQPVDCLAFPTSSSYRNPRRGVAGCVHQRAGPDLDRTVENVGLRGRATAGSVLSTMGCASGMRLLVHCVGPTGGLPDSEELLCKTYVNALLAADNNHVTCAAVASISTGQLQFPIASAADVALAAVRDLIRLHPHWATKIAFVCLDEQVYAQFQRARQETLRAFHTAGFAFPQVLSPDSSA